MRKRWINAVLMVILLLGLLPAVHAAETSDVSVWDGTCASSLQENEQGAYVISTAAELAYWAEMLHASTSSADKIRNNTVLLAADIDLNEVLWTPPRSSAGNGFQGTFDGQGHTISGLNVSSTNGSAGFIGAVGTNGIIKNLTVRGSVTGKDYTGGIVGFCYGRVYNCVADVEVNGANYVGGICGGGNGETWIEGCVNLGSIYADSGVGGMLGIGEGAIVKNCYNRGSINAGGDGAGIASAVFGYEAEIVNCYSTGTVNARNTSSIVGYAGPVTTRDGEPINCYYLNSANYTGASLNMKGTGKSAQELKQAASLLGAAWVKDIYGINDGYPILSWQAPKAEDLTPLSKPMQPQVSISKNTATVTSAESTQDSYARTLYRIGTKDEETEIWGDWQSDCVFYGLAPNRTYFFQTMYATSQPAKYTDSEPCDPVLATVGTLEGYFVLDAPILNMAKAVVDATSVQLPIPEIPEQEGALWSDQSVIQYRICVDGVWEAWVGESDFFNQNGHTFTDLEPGKSYSFQARYVPRIYGALASPSSETLSLTTSSGMMHVNFRLIGLTLPKEKITLEDQNESGYYGAKYRNWLSTASYEVPANITATNFVAYPLSQNGLNFHLENSWFTWIDAPSHFSGEGYGGSDRLQCIEGYLYGKNAGWFLFVIRDGVVIQEALPDSGTTILQEGDTVVLCFCGDRAYELKTVPGMTGFNSPAINYGKTDFIYYFLNTPDLTKEECIELRRVEGIIDELVATSDSDANIVAAEQAYKALNDGQKKALRNYDKLVQTRITYEAFFLGLIDSDDKKDQADVTILTRWLAGWPVEIDPDRADFNMDGEVTALDLVIFRRHLAGWPNYQTLPYTPPIEEE